VSTLAVLASLWLAIGTAFIAWRWFAGRGVGLVVSVILGLSAIHLIAALLYLLPWYYEGYDPGVVDAGFRVAFQGLCAFCLGAVLAVRGMKKSDGEPDGVAHAAAPYGWAYIISGIIMYAVLWPRMGRIASLGALVAAGSSYVVLGICLRCWTADHARLARWLGASALLPFLTILTQGYLSYGLAALMAVIAFVAETARSRKALLVVGLLLGYVTMSFYVTYMRDRAQIRDTVWNGAEAGRRMDVIAKSLSQFEWFDIYDPDHLLRVDDRLNQDYLVGLAVDRLRRREVGFGNGETVKDAFIALLPRALWPEKGVVAGSMDIVSRYTGLTFMEGTSVGVGLVMELFVNFGLPGVWIGFAAFGALLVFIDIRAHGALIRGDAPRFAVWYLPGSSLLQLCGGSLVDGSASAAAAIVSVLIVNVIVTATVVRSARRAPALVPERLL
jgi:hypothetical protein